MKKYSIILALSLVLTIILVGCTKLEGGKLNTLKRVVYEKLEDEDKIKLDGDYLKASVERVVLTKDSGIILDERYIDEEVYKIDFIGKDTGTIPNNKVIFVNDGFLDIIGYGYLD